MTALQTEYLPVDTLTPYERNARKHDDIGIAAIKSSIEQFGFLDPIGIWGPKNLIVEGHGRLMAAKELGMEQVPCIRLDALSDEQRRAYALAHNKTTELSGWDFEMLDLEIGELEDAGFDLKAVGFDSLAPSAPLDEFFAPAEEKEPPEPKKVQCPKCGEWFTPE